MASTLLALDAIRELVQTGLSDAALEVVVDAEDAAIVDLLGPHTGTTTTTLSVSPGSRTRRLILHQRADSIEAVSEYWPDDDPSEAVDVPASEFLLDRGFQLVRHGGNCWRDRVIVTMTPDRNLARRRAALVDLVRLRLQFTGLASEDEGSHSYSAIADHEAERQRILVSIDDQRVVV